MHIKGIHQFSFACSAGDGVTNGMLFTRKLLRQLGFASEIYSDTIPEEMSAEVHPLARLNLRDDEVLITHHCMGYDNWEWLTKLAVPKIMIYHNITPVHLLPADGDIRRWAALGREQLRDWAPGYLGAIGVSELNSRELRENHYQNVATIPLLVDVEQVRDAAYEEELLPKLRNAYNILFVGRISENKRQLELVEMLNHLRYRCNQPVRLILAGSTSSWQYLQQIKRRIQELGLEQHVLVAGKVSEARLAALYRSADAFVCLSEHEGFGMPLIEAMLHDVPVLARDSSNIASTLGEGGMLLAASDGPYECAVTLSTLLAERGLRRRVIAGQRRNLRRFSSRQLARQLAEYLQQLGIDVPHMPAREDADAARPSWQIQGPFDSSYSLAIVNRELARALAKRGADVSLRSREGGGEFPPAADFLQANPDCAALFARAATLQEPPQVALRFCYPPYLDDMPAAIRAVHSYGWEETGFPQEYVNHFNRKLDLVTVLSRNVAKTLRDSGVRVPIAVTGGGVDQLLELTAEAPPDGLMTGCKAFRFLHVSSCFPRKGVDVLLRAYGAAFRSDDEVSLLIKTFPNPHNDVAQQLERLRTQDPGYPHVVLIEEEFTPQQLAGLYQASHAFVAPSRGEGLGLPMAEAMLFDLPVITTAWGGQTEFCDASTAWLCDYQFAKADTHFGMTHSLWAEPDAGHLTDLLKEVFSASEEQKKPRITAARARILRDFNWEQVAARTQQAVQTLSGQPLLSKEARIGWLSTWNARCGIATYSNFLTRMMPQHRLTVLANHIPERMAVDEPNIVRCWNTSDEESLDYVLEIVEEQGITAVVVQYNFSFFTLATLAQFIRSLSQRGVGAHIFFHSTADVVLPEQTKTLRSIADELALAERIYVHGVEDVNRLKGLGLVDNVSFFPHGVAPTLRVPAKAASDPETLAGKTVIASYGFLLPHKGIQQLIEAFAILAAADDSLHLLLLNALYPVSVSDEVEWICRDTIHRLNLADRVSFITEFLPEQETQTRLSRADLIVFPYQHTQESSSAAVRTGLATGKPVAVTPLHIFDDVLEAVHTLPGTEPDALARGIAALLAKPEIIIDKQAHAARWAAERQWPALSLRLLNLIDGLANPLDSYAGNI